MIEVRFHLDENVRRTIAEQLRRRGVDVSLTPEEGLINAPDEEQIRFALNTGRVIFTQDEDLLALAQARSHAGIVYCKQRSRSIGRIVEFLRIVHGASTAEEMYGRKEYVPCSALDNAWTISEPKSALLI